MKLWIVRVEKSGYVMANTEAEALELQGEIERWEDYPVVSASLAGSRLLHGWDDDCLVYTDTHEDIKLGEAREICA